jgi:hypothetical protein
VHKLAMIRSPVPRVGGTLAPAIEGQQLMADQHGFGDNRTQSTPLCQSAHGNDRMNEQDVKSSIPAIVSTPQKPAHSH